MKLLSHTPRRGATCATSNAIIAITLDTWSPSAGPKVATRKVNAHPGTTITPTPTPTMTVTIITVARTVVTTAITTATIVTTAIIATSITMTAQMQQSLTLAHGLPSKKLTMMSPVLRLHTPQHTLFITPKLKPNCMTWELHTICPPSTINSEISIPSHLTPSHLLTITPFMLQVQGTYKLMSPTVTPPLPSLYTSHSMCPTWRLPSFPSAASMEQVTMLTSMAKQNLQYHQSIEHSNWSYPHKWTQTLQSWTCLCSWYEPCQNSWHPHPPSMPWPYLCQHHLHPCAQPHHRWNWAYWQWFPHHLQLMWICQTHTQSHPQEAKSSTSGKTSHDNLDSWVIC